MTNGHFPHPARPRPGPARSAPPSSASLLPPSPPHPFRRPLPSPPFSAAAAPGPCALLGEFHPLPASRGEVPLLSLRGAGHARRPAQTAGHSETWQGKARIRPCAWPIVSASRTDGSRQMCRRGGTALGHGVAWRAGGGTEAAWSGRRTCGLATTHGRRAGEGSCAALAPVGVARRRPAQSRCPPATGASHRAGGGRGIARREASAGRQGIARGRATGGAGGGRTAGRPRCPPAGGGSCIVGGRKRGRTIRSPEASAGGREIARGQAAGGAGEGEDGRPVETRGGTTRTARGVRRWAGDRTPAGGGQVGQGGGRLVGRGIVRWRRADNGEDHPAARGVGGVFARSERTIF